MKKAVGIFFMLVGLSLLSTVVYALILGFTLDPCLAIINVPALTERLSGLSFGERFILIFTIRLIIGVLTPTQPTQKAGGEV
jgi:hypothetical protein